MIDRYDEIGIPEEITSISGELYAAINKAVEDPEWREDSYKKYLASLKEIRIDNVESAIEKQDNQESMCVEIQAALDYLPAKEGGVEGYNKSVMEATCTALSELDLNNGKYQEIVNNNPTISERAMELVNQIKGNIKKFLAAAAIASCLIGGPAGGVSLTGTAEARDIVTSTIDAINQSTHVSYRHGRIRTHFDQRNYERKLGRSIARSIENDIKDSLREAKKNYKKSVERQERMGIAQGAMFRGLEGMTEGQREVALRTLILGYEMGGTKKQETIDLAMVANAICGTQLDRMQLDDVNLFLKEMTNNYKFSGSKYYEMEDVYYVAHNMLLHQDPNFDRELSMINTLLTVTSLTTQAMERGDIKTGNKLLGIMDKIYDNTKRFYDSPSLRQTIRETRHVVKAAAEQYTTKDTVKKYDLGIIDVDPDMRVIAQNAAAQEQEMDRS